MARKAGRTKPMSPFTKDNAYGNCFSIFGKYSFFLFWS